MNRLKTNIIKVVMVAGLIPIVANCEAADETEISVGTDNYTYPDVDEEVAMDYFKATLRRNALLFDGKVKVGWDEVQGRVTEVYSYNGEEKYYLTYIYVGNEKLPSENEIYKIAEKRYALETEYYHNKSIDSDYTRSEEGRLLKSEIDGLLFYPSDEKSGIYISGSISAGPPDMSVVGPVSIVYGGMPTWIYNKPFAEVTLKDATGTDKFEFEGYILQNYGSRDEMLYFKFSVEGEYYYVPYRNYTICYSEDDFVNEVASEWKPYYDRYSDRLQYNLENRRNTLDKLELLKEESEYIDTTLGFNRTGPEGPDPEKASHTPDYFQIGGTCTITSLAAMVGYEMWYNRDTLNVIYAWYLLPYGRDENEYTGSFHLAEDFGYYLMYKESPPTGISFCGICDEYDYPTEGLSYSQIIDVMDTYCRYNFNGSGHPNINHWEYPGCYTRYNTYSEACQDFEDNLEDILNDDEHVIAYTFKEYDHVEHHTWTVFYWEIYDAKYYLWAYEGYGTQFYEAIIMQDVWDMQDQVGGRIDYSRPVTYEPIGVRFDYILERIDNGKSLLTITDNTDNIDNGRLHLTGYNEDCRYETYETVELRPGISDYVIYTGDTEFEKYALSIVDEQGKSINVGTPDEVK